MPMAETHITIGSWRGGWLLSLAVLVVMAGLGYVWLDAQHQQDQSAGLPRALEPFEWTDQHGQKVTLDRLKGSPWIACFFFTRCSVSCPQLMQAMLQLQARIRNPDIKLVAFSVQSSHDTVAVLHAYAEKLGADPQRWLFLTGDQESMHRFIQNNFLASVAFDPQLPPDVQVSHSNRFYIVDGQGSLRYHREVVSSVDPMSNRPPFTIHANELRWVQLHAIDLVFDGGIGISDLPRINALLNGTALLLLLLGGMLIRLKQRGWHAATMISAFMVSSLFLTSYLTYHAFAGDTPFPHQGTVRWMYLSILISHVFLAIVIVPMILVVLYSAYRGAWRRHRRWARWTWPLWVYVSMTGILVYYFLYELFPITKNM